MNTKPTRMLFAAVALSALAAVLSGSAQARIPEGNGTRPPSRTVVDEQQAPQGSGTLRRPRVRVPRSRDQDRDRETLPRRAPRSEGGAYG